VRMAELEAGVRRAMLIKWRDELIGVPSKCEQRIVSAVLPCFVAWMESAHGAPTFRLTQVLSGHGCFGEYLCRINKEDTPQCHHCDAARDSAQHTLQWCPAWSEERRILVGKVGCDHSIAAVVAKMSFSVENWEAVASFCEVVMKRKRAAETKRECLGLRGYVRRRRRGGRGAGSAPLSDNPVTLPH